MPTTVDTLLGRERLRYHAAAMRAKQTAALALLAVCVSGTLCLLALVLIWSVADPAILCGVTP